MSETNYEITVAQIRGILRLPRQASCSDIVARVRELKAIEDLSLEVHKRLKQQAAGCAACDRGDYQLGHADHCPKAASSTDHNRAQRDGAASPL